MLRRGRMLVLAAGLAVLLVGGPARSFAACSSAYPSFAEAAREADRLVIGTVTHADPPDDYATDFTVAVEHTIRGDESAVIEVHSLLYNEACGSVLMARQSDRIALAIGPSELDPSVEVGVMAYVAGTPFRPDVPMVTVAEVYALAGAVPPDTAASGPTDGATGTGVALLVLALLLAAGRPAASVLVRRSR